MNETNVSHEAEMGNPTREEIMAALFANMVIQQINMAMMFLGKVAHPETGEFIQDIETARMFIEQLEMLAVKTKGNLSREEEALLKQGLTALHMAFVEAVNAAQSGEKPKPQEQIIKSPAPEPAAPAAAAPQPSAPPANEAAAPDDSRKKFSKKY